MEESKQRLAKCVLRRHWQEVIDLGSVLGEDKTGIGPSDDEPCRLQLLVLPNCSACLCSDHAIADAAAAERSLRTAGASGRGW